jgi:hypothetical protein
MKTGALVVLETLGGRDGQLRYCAVQERLRHLTEGTVVARREASCRSSTWAE